MSTTEVSGKPDTEKPATEGTAVADVLRLPHSPAAVALARHRVRGELAAVGLSRTLLDDIEVVVSELLGNAVRHARPIAGGALLVGWRVENDRVTLKVTDGGAPGSRPAPRSGDLLAEAGRGLRIVEGLTDQWGVVDHVGDLRTVWALLTSPARHPVAGSLRLRI
ncbi:MAG TPA: ATP-binding protein [Kineosporiaceae bacterium]|nr:ATP-binding protein [Kineosporiaceae bacterium]